MIDTRLWALAMRAGLAPAGTALADLGERARSVVADLRARDTLLFTPQLVAEIQHVVTSRGAHRMPAPVARAYLSQLLTDRRTRFRTLSRGRLLRSLEMSAASGIHVWDYLVVLPWEGEIDRIVTMDPHFQHADFTRLAPVENPIGPWRHEGQPLA